MSITVRPEVPSDIADIEALTVAAFLNAPHASHTEHLIVRPIGLEVVLYGSKMPLY